MSFGNTKTPLKPADSEAVRWPLSLRRSARGPLEYYMDAVVEQKFRELYPVTLNPTLMEWFGLSHSCLHRFAREMGLSKDMSVIHRLHSAQVRQTCRRNGYYRSLKGKAPSEACREASRKKRAEGFVPLKALKESDPKRYERVMRKRSRQRKRLIEEEKRRYDLGFMPVSNLDPRCYQQVRFTSRETTVRWRARKLGYVVGDRDPDLGERHTIYYRLGMERHDRFEKFAWEVGFMFRALPAGRNTNT